MDSDPAASSKPLPFAPPPSPPRPPLPVIKVELNLRTAALALGSLAAVWLFIQLWPVALIIVVALMLVGALNPVVDALTKRGLSRTWAIAVVYLLMAGVALSFLLLTVPKLVAQVSDLLRQLPAVQHDVASRLATMRLGASFSPSVASAKWPELLLNLAKAGLRYSPQVIEGLGSCVVALFLSLYFLLERDRLRGALYSLIPRTHHVRASRVLVNLEVIVGGYMRGQVLTSLMMSVFTFILLTIMGVPSAVALAAFAGLTDVLPYIGGLLGTVPAVLAALTHSTTSAIVVCIGLLVYQEVESRVIVPQLYGKVLRLPAAIITISLLVGAKLLGIVGALLALPIAAAIGMIVSELRFELPGESKEGSAGKEREEAAERDENAEREFERRAEGVSPDRAAAIAMDIAEEQRQRHGSSPNSTA